MKIRDQEDSQLPLSETRVGRKTAKVKTLYGRAEKQIALRGARHTSDGARVICAALQHKQGLRGRVIREELYLPPSSKKPTSGV